MAYLLIDDGCYDDPKMIDLYGHERALEAFALWHLALAWAKRKADPSRRDEAGILPAGMHFHLMAPLTATGAVGTNGDGAGAVDEAAALLVEVGLWEQYPAPDGGGYRIHNFAKWQQLDQWAARSAQGRRAAQARWDQPALDAPDADAMRGHSGGTDAGDADAMPDGGDPAMRGQYPPHITSPQQTASKDASGARTGSRLPEGWKPSPKLLAWAREQVPDVNLRRETEKFTDHWRAASGQTARKRDWDAAWRNWMRRADDGPPGRQTRRRPPASEDRNAEWLDR
jgi:hypothetical protein